MGRKEEVVTKFDKMAPFYDPGVFILSLAVGGEKALRNKVIDVADIQKGENILEMGCGTGSNLLIAANRTGHGGWVTGVDPSARMLARAEKKIAGKNNISLVQAADRLPFPDGTFDVIMYFLVLHELPFDVRLQSLVEAVRLLKKGGRLLVGDFGSPETPWIKRLFHFALRAEEAEASDYVARGLAQHIESAVANSLEICGTKELLGGAFNATLLKKLA